MRPAKAPPKPRVVVQRVYVPTPRPVRTTSAVRHAPARSNPSRGKPAPARVEEPVTPLAAPKTPPVAQPADEPKQVAEQDDGPRKADRHRKSERPKKAEKPRRSEKPKEAKKPKDHGSAKKDKPSGGRHEDRDDQGDDRGGHEKGEHGHGRGDHG
jgi:colicin import membrane protein